MFDLALGHDPVSSTLASIVKPNLPQADLASAFVSSQTFANVYNAGVILNPNTLITSANDSIITALFVNGLGHAPTQNTLNGFHGLTLANAFLEFSQSQAAGVSPIVDGSLTQILELATGIPAQGPTITPQSFTLTLTPFVDVYLKDVMDAVSGAPGAVFPSGSLTSLPVTTINQTLELTVGSDTAISGQAFDGTGPTVLSNGVEINAPLSGPFGNQATLTPADVINLSGTGNILNATFDGSSILVNMTIEGVQTWNITQAALGFTEVAIEGTSGSLNGLTSLTYNGNGFTGSDLIIGTPVAGTGIASAANGFNLTVSNDPGGVVEVFFGSSSFVGGDQINATANAGGAPLTIESGSGGAAGFATWNVTSNGANGGTNSLALGALGSKDAKTLMLSDDGSGTTVITAAGDPADWANLTTINALGSGGTLTITGGELASGDGLLADDTTALTLVEGGSGADTFDLSAYAGTVAEVCVTTIRIAA